MKTIKETARYRALLFEIYAAKTRNVGLSISPEKVAIIRKKRFQYVGPSDYLDVDSIRKALLYSHEVFRNISRKIISCTWRIIILKKSRLK